MSEFMQPLSIYFIWHENASEQVKPIIDYFSNLLSRDVHKPFSRAINIPIFYKFSNQDAPEEIVVTSKKTIVYYFICDKIVINKKWEQYIVNQHHNSMIEPIYIALTNNISALASLIDNSNFIRMDNTPQNPQLKFDEYMFISLTNELYRRIVSDIQINGQKLKETGLKVFLSHSKYDREGKTLALSLKSFIDNSTMQNFFDAYDIQVGSNFETVIKKNIQESTFIAISTDTYSSRYWCQREIIHAKEMNRPMIVVDLLRESEDRRFPYASNVPTVHVSADVEINETVCLNILITALIETIRWNYSFCLLQEYNKSIFSDKDIDITLRPPDFVDLNRLVKKEDGSVGFQIEEIMYPDPPVYNEELNFLSKFNLVIFTPLEALAERVKVSKIGLSISNPVYENKVHEIYDGNRLKKLSQDIGRYILMCGSSIVYGGDLRTDGYTDFILNEAKALKYKCPDSKINVVNLVAWPIYLNESYDYTKTAAQFVEVAELLLLEPAESIKTLVDDKQYLEYDSPVNHYIWSESLTSMRQKLIEETDVRIMAGGKFKDYKGCMPGLLEEFILSAEKGTPIYLLGGYGGITELICNSIIEGIIEEELTYEWQLCDGKIAALFSEAKERGCNYSLKYKNLPELLQLNKLNNGLELDENFRLFKSQYTEEALLLILTGLSRLNKEE